MKNDFSKIKINSKEELIALVNEINVDIEFANITRPKDEQEKPLDLDYILKRYKGIEARNYTKRFKEKHDCKNCFYYKRPRRCFETLRCPLDDVLLDKSHAKKIKYPKNCEGNCLYGNEVGTCFGFCYKKILKEIKEAKKNEE